MDEIQRSAGIGLCFDEDRGTRANSTTPGFALAHRKTFLAIEQEMRLTPDGSPSRRSKMNSRR
ncbi:hypothetical protein AGR3A_pa50005 [Agrobacterium tomkonis CFBP 6623]|uniref:Uncharacterized protein n=1 Tax=Agrobacterium tomkonis CFBP 6623 TaxID=1183432 RepID=A0A1S7S9A9_9HYPH|nr:hypothetical protein AGR3A_pa50005 [Agrobacterium tomkonis CFBP 6623]